MNKKTKIALIISSIIMIVLALIIVFTREVPNTASVGGVITFDDVTKDNLRFSNATLSDNNLTVLVQNTTSSNYNLRYIDVKFLNASGQEIATISGYIGESLSTNEVRNMNIKTDLDLSNTKTVTYTINK